MLDIYTKLGWIPICEYQEYYTDYEYDGTQILSFDVPIDSDILQYIKNEVPIKNEENSYLIKTVNKRKTQCSVTCELDLDEWKTNKPYKDTKNDPAFQTKTLAQLLDYIKPVGWTIINANITEIKRSVELKDVSKKEVLFSLQDIFSVVYEIRCLTKEILIVNPNQTIDKGLYITPQLNLDSIEWKGTSDKFCTRLYAYGKDELSFADINNGKDYVENKGYSDKQVCLTWRDDRYTVKESLLDDAKKKLKEISIPSIAYTVTVNDLAKVDSNYKFLEFHLYDIANTIIDENTSILQSIVKYRKFHDTPEKNVITLSTEPQKITSKIDKVSSILGDDGQKFQGSILQQAQQEATQLINNFATKGHIYLTENELYILDQSPKESAKYVLRINLGGIAFSQNGWAGPYTSAWTIDGKFNADFITAGTLKAINIEGVNISGAKITGGSVTGETTISVGTDLTVGNNIYIGQNQTSASAFKKLQFTSNDYIAFSKLNNTDAGNSIQISAQRSISAYAGDRNNSVFSNILMWGSGASFSCAGLVSGQLSSNANSLNVSENSASLSSYNGIANVYGENEVSISGKKITFRNGPAIVYRGMQLLYESAIEFYRSDGNYIGKIQALSSADTGAIGLGIMADSGDNIFMGAGNTWYFVVSGGGSYSQPLNAYGNLDMHGWNIVNSSDKRLKENVQNIDTGFIYDLEIKVFDYIEGNKDIVGIVANSYADKDYAKYFISQGIDGLYSVNYQNINNALIQCVQEQKKEIDNLEKRLEALENLIKGLIK